MDSKNHSSIQISSTSEALTYLYGLSLDKSNLSFRGQADFDWILQPSIYRFNSFKRYQTVAFEEFLIAAKPSEPLPPFTHTTLDLEWLMLCQHYGVPTRLLDWTSEILIALFFACHAEENMEKDGALFICDQIDYPMFGAYNHSARDTQDLAFISTNIVNPRLRSQSGCFMIWGHAPLDDTSKESYHLSQYHNLLKPTCSLTKIRIPKESKPQILRELEDFYSITHDNVYLKNSTLERRLKELKRIEYHAKLQTLYVTDADKLTRKEKRFTKRMFKIACENMIGECQSLTQISFVVGLLK